MNINEICDKLRAGSDTLALQTAAQKNIALSAVISSIEQNRSAILAANDEDVAAARAKAFSAFSPFTCHLPSSFNET